MGGGERMSQKPPYYEHDRRALRDAVRCGMPPEIVKERTRRAVANQLKLEAATTSKARTDERGS